MTTEGLTAVVIGAGQAGARAAKAIRAAGFQGAIKLIGDEAHAPYERPFLSKALLKDPRTPIPFVFPEALYGELGIELLRGRRATAIDRRAKCVRLSDGDRIPYDRLMLATGSRLRTVSIPGYPAEHILHLRSLDDCREIEQRIVGMPRVAIIGGGFIGLEVACTLRSRDANVTVVELANRLLPRLNCAEASEGVLAHHRASGVDIRLGRSVVSGAETELVLDDGSKIDADFVIAGIGVLPQTELAEDAGLVVENGIVVDEYGRTSDPDIFACGDVTRHYNPLLGRHLRLESWENANLQADAAGRTLAGEPTSAAEIPWLWSDQGSFNLQVAGAAHDVDRVIVRGQLADEGVSLFQFQHGRLVGGVTLNRGKDMTMIRRLIKQGSLALAPEQLADEQIPLKQFMFRDQTSGPVRRPAQTEVSK